MRFLLAILLASCVTAPRVYPPGPISGQILVKHAVCPGLSSQWCNEFRDGMCVDFRRTCYDLENVGTRAQLIKLGFVCQFGGRPLAICSDKAGFCWKEERCESTFLGICTKKVVIRDFYKQDDVRLMNSGLVCYNRHVWDDRDLP